MARKITTSTDKYGRTVYKITGTKKYAFSLAKAKKIAASLDGASVRKPAKKTAKKTTRRPAKKTTALARVRKPAKRTAKRDASGRFVKRKSTAKKTTRRNAGRRMTQAQLDAIMAKVRAKKLARTKKSISKTAKGGLTLAQTKAIARTAYFLVNGSMEGATSSVNAAVKKAGRIGGDLYGYLAQNPDLIVEATEKYPAVAAKGYFDDSGYAYEWETH